LCELGLARLGGLPEILFDDAQVRHLCADPLRFWVAA
jgi:hypothetical protein